jgi:hypothetical protein
MKVFIRKFEQDVLYGFSDEAERNENRPRKDEKMAGVSARKVAEWRRIIKQFTQMQNELLGLYESQTD